MRRALIVIDVQNEYVTGELPIEYPPLTESLPNIARAMDAAESATVPVAVVRQYGPAGSRLFAEGSDGAALHASVAARRRDAVFVKTLPSAFPDTDLEQWLRDREVDTVAVVGYMTQNCVESTIRDAAHRGFAVEYLSDAAGTLALQNEAGAVSARQLHDTASVVLQSRFAAVVSTDEWCSAVAAGTALAGSTIYASTAGARAQRDAH